MEPRLDYWSNVQKSSYFTGGPMMATIARNAHRESNRTLFQSESVGTIEDDHAAARLNNFLASKGMVCRGQLGIFSRWRGSIHPRGGDASVSCLPPNTKSARIDGAQWVRVTDYPYLQLEGVAQRSVCRYNIHRKSIIANTPRRSAPSTNQRVRVFETYCWSRLEA